MLDEYKNCDTTHEDKNIKVSTVTPYKAGKILGKNAETIRAGLRSNSLPFGTAIPPKKPGGNWNYIIIESKLLEYAGIKQ